MKKNCVEIKKINGNIKYRKDNELIKTNMMGKYKLAFNCEKKDNSSKTLMIIIKLKKTKVVFNVIIKNSFIINF